MKKSILLTMSLLTILSLSACNNSNDQVSNNSSTSILEPTVTPSTEVPPTSEESSDDDIVVSHKATIHLTDTIDLTGKLSDANPKAKFISYFNHHTMPDFLLDIDANQAVEIKLYKNDKGVNESLLSLGSRKNNGSITFTFSKQITEASFFARPCYKYYNAAWHNDTDVSLEVRVDDTILTTTPLTEGTSTTNKPELTEVNVKFNEPTTSFTLTNIGDVTDDIGNRLFLEMMELEFNS